jgi:hypothetical protein
MGVSARGCRRRDELRSYREIQFKLPNRTFIDRQAAQSSFKNPLVMLDASHAPQAALKEGIILPIIQAGFAAAASLIAEQADLDEICSSVDASLGTALD